MNPNFPVNTVQIMRGAVAAEMDGALAKYVEAVFHHMWEEPKKMDDPEVIRAALDASGLDGARTLARIQEQDVKDKLLKNTEATVARGTFGTPTFFVGEEMFFGKDRLRDVEEEIEAQKAAAVGQRGSPASHLVVVHHQPLRLRHRLAGQNEAALDLPGLERIVGGHLRLALDQLGAAGAAHAALARVGHADAGGQRRIHHLPPGGTTKRWRMPSRMATPRCPARCLGLSSALAERCFAVAALRAWR